MEIKLDAFVVKAISKNVIFNLNAVGMFWPVPRLITLLFCGTSPSQNLSTH